MENSTDYSLQNTTRRALFLPTSREVKYKALQAIETFFWRAGDMLSALATLLFVQVLSLGVRTYALVNLALVAVWLVVAARSSAQASGLKLPGTVNAPEATVWAIVIVV